MQIYKNIRTVKPVLRRHILGQRKGRNFKFSMTVQENGGLLIQVTA
jgi:hypothetical protein